MTGAIIPFGQPDDRLGKERVPPFDAEAEAALLGTILLNRTAYERVAETLKAEHFAVPLHAAIYEIMTELVDHGRPITAVALGVSLDLDDNYSRAGGKAYLAHLSGAAGLPMNLTEYARIIRDLFLKRQLIELHESGLVRAYAGAGPELTSGADMIEAAARSLDELATTGETNAVPEIAVQVEDAVEQFNKAYRGEGVLGYPTKLEDLDKMLVGKGFRPGLLYVLAARPAMGKTSLAVTLAENADGPVFFASLEMMSAEIHQRRIARAAGISFERMFEGEIGEPEAEKVNTEAMRLRLAPFYVDDTPGLTIGAIRRRAARQQRRMKGLKLIVVDHLGLIRPDQPRDNRTHQIEQITGDCKRLAKDMDVPVLLLSQLSRAVEQRDDKRPHMADLRDSGSIEQDADVVMMMYREEYYLQKETPAKRLGETDDKFAQREKEHFDRLDACRNVTEIGIEKQRNGRSGTVRLHFDPQTMTFHNIALRGHFDLV